MKFKIIEKKKLYGADALQKNFFEPRKAKKKKKESSAWKDALGYYLFQSTEEEENRIRSSEMEHKLLRAEASEDEKQKKKIKTEATLSGAGFPAATADGQQAIDKFPVGAPAKKKKKKRRMIRRVSPII